MGRLLNPGLGELLDRLTILRLKIIHNVQSPGQIDHFRMEEAQVNMLLDRMGYPDDNDVLLLGVKLQQCNAKLWELEDEMMRYANLGDLAEFPASQQDCARVAVAIWRMNRERNALIHEINTATGGAPEAREKL